MKKAQVEKQLLEVAMKHSIAMEVRKSFKKKNSDSEDFVEMAIWNLKAMLEDAYRLGQESR